MGYELEVQFTDEENRAARKTLKVAFLDNKDKLSNIFRCMLYDPDVVWNGDDLVHEVHEIHGLPTWPAQEVARILSAAWHAGLCKAEEQNDGDGEGPPTDSWLAYRLEDWVRWEMTLDGCLAWLRMCLDV